MLKKPQFKLNYLSLVLVLLIHAGVVAQSISREKFNDSVQKIPYFTIHQDNYFISGVPTNKNINSNTADVKYQISFKQIITRDILPWNTFLFLTYTQKAFWDVYEDSFPFNDINFNPSLALGKPVFNRNNELRGLAIVAFEHESNGRDSIFSRSWNRLTLNYTTKIFKNTTGSFKAWLPFAYKTGNPDLLEYVGLAEINIEHQFIPNKLYAHVMFRKGLNFEGKGAIRSRIYYNPFKKNTSNQYLMLEWYLGQGEGLLNYKESQSMIRLGYVIKTNEFNFFR